jgi:hypothetical protein
METPTRFQHVAYSMGSTSFAISKRFVAIANPIPETLKGDGKNFSWGPSKRRRSSELRFFSTRIIRRLCATSTSICRIAVILPSMSGASLRWPSASQGSFRSLLASWALHRPHHRHLNGCHLLWSPGAATFRRGGTSAKKNGSVPHVWSAPMLGTPDKHRTS